MIPRGYGYEPPSPYLLPLVPGPSPAPPHFMAADQISMIRHNAEIVHDDFRHLVQHLVDYIDREYGLPDGGYTFPDGEFWPASRST